MRSSFRRTRIFFLIKTTNDYVLFQILENLPSVRFDSLPDVHVPRLSEEQLINQLVAHSDLRNSNLIENVNKYNISGIK